MKLELDGFSKHDPELVELLEEALDGINETVQRDYLINVITYPPYKNKTLKEALEEEIRKKKELFGEITAEKLGNL